ncbi:DOPA 4,5-dioxygenase [Mycena indigotica]|uniref:DOPA 4,5-dioxygenase n=1 Tax=Mycena indigotica TaxID=2126181 RepID=A0A8H6S836_9AGAR|nr:DOPA 4,5-dioxygenase [Mycena indigotica]KAF7294598.1 DOPA 4,5-dioxygenase [Mycena indigotica]
MNFNYSGRRPATDLKTVLKTEIKEWHFHIYFHQTNAEERQYALELRDAILCLRRDGAFVAVPLFRVNEVPMGPHPVGSYEVWVPSETFASVYSYLCMNRGPLSILVHPITREERMKVLFCLMPADVVSDHDSRSSWIGPPFPLDLTKLPILTVTVPLQYPSLSTTRVDPVLSPTLNISLEVGYSSNNPYMSLEDRAALGANVEKMLLKEKDAARAPMAS